MKVLLTGATGFVGKEVTRQLTAGGRCVRALVRDAASPAARGLAARFGVELATGGLEDREAVRVALSGVDAVVHLVGIISEVGASTFERVHARGTAALVEAVRAAGVGRFLHMSALGTRPGAASRYHQTKWAAEEAVRNSGLDWTILRPSLIYGPEDHFVNLFAGLSRWSPVLPVMGGGRSLLQPVAVESVARCFAVALTEPRSVQRTFDLCGPERLTLPEILRQILEVSGRRRWVVRVPLRLARAQAVLLETLFPRLLGKAPPFNRDQLTMLGEDNVGDPGPAQSLLGLSAPRFREGIARYVRPGAGRLR